MEHKQEVPLHCSLFQLSRSINIMNCHRYSKYKDRVCLLRCPTLSEGNESWMGSPRGNVFIAVPWVGTGAAIVILFNKGLPAFLPFRPSEILFGAQTKRNDYRHANGYLRIRGKYICNYQHGQKKVVKVGEILYMRVSVHS